MPKPGWHNLLCSHKTKKFTHQSPLDYSLGLLAHPSYFPTTSFWHDFKNKIGLISPLLIRPCSLDKALFPLHFILSLNSQVFAVMSFVVFIVTSIKGITTEITLYKSHQQMSVKSKITIKLYGTGATVQKSTKGWFIWGEKQPPICSFGILWKVLNWCVFILTHMIH